MSKTFTSQPSRQTKTTAERPVNRRAPLNQQADTSSRTVGTTRARSLNMNHQIQTYHGMTGRNSGFNNAPTTGQHNIATDTAGRLQSPQRTPTYAGGYSVIPPNERKRQQISQMAQRETEEYERHRQANAVRHVSHVGTVGGGDITEEQVRKEQERALRRQKLDRLKRQEEQRNARKKAEDAEIEQKRAEARRKAEQNAIKNGKVPSPEEIR
ncbi:unnamed protein product, partial [Candidula unifasciata]